MSWIRRRTIRLGLLGAALIGAFPVRAAAQVPNPFRLTGLIGGAFFLSDIMLPPEQQALVDRTGFDDSFATGFELGYRFATHWELEGFFLLAPTEVTAVVGTIAVSVDQDRDIVGGNLLYYFGGEEGVRPFASVGAGVKGDEIAFQGFDNVDFTVALGGGVSLPVSRLFEVRFSVRDYVSSFDAFADFPDTNASTQHDVYLLGGASLHL